jgi:hypothetical protein
MRRALLALLLVISFAAACGQQTGLRLENGGKTVETVPDTTSPARPPKGIVSHGVVLGPRADLGYDDGTVWAAVWAGPNLLGSLVQIDATTGTAVGKPKELPPSPKPYLLAVGSGAIWLATGRNVWRVDPLTGSPSGPTDVGGLAKALLVTPTGVWVSAREKSGGALVKLSTADGSDRGSVPIGAAPGPITEVPGAVWAVDPTDGTLSRIVPATLRREGRRIPVRARGSDPASQITVYDGSVWIYEGNVVLRVPPGKTAPTQKVTLPTGAPGDMAAGSGGIWVSDGDQLLRIDATSGTIAETHTVRGAHFTTLITGNDSVWALDARHGRLVRLKVE